jgi:hypothetical protein
MNAAAAAAAAAADGGGPSLLPYFVIHDARDTGEVDAADAAMAAVGGGCGAWFVKATATNNALGVRATARLDVPTRAWMAAVEAGARATAGGCGVVLRRWRECVP